MACFRRRAPCHQPCQSICASEFIEAGSSRRQAAERFGVGKVSAIRWHARFRDAGEIVPKPAGGEPGRRKNTSPLSPAEGIAVAQIAARALTDRVEHAE
jgi:hypothetical protein